MGENTSEYRRRWQQDPVMLDVAKRLGAQLKILLDSQGLKQKDLASALEQTNMSPFVSGEKLPSIPSLIRMGHFLGVRPADLLQNALRPQPTREFLAFMDEMKGRVSDEEAAWLASLNVPGRRLTVHCYHLLLSAFKATDPENGKDKDEE